jgi:16S rRNA (cytosine1402-N4)-methyltransferase
MTMNAFHFPVMLKQSVDGLSIQPNGVYVDATFGGGGHSREILERLEGGKLFAFDQDEEAAKNSFPDQRLTFIRHNFRYLKNFLRYYGVNQVDGILADLGVSSHDFDEAGRGFSFRFDTVMDMRMNREIKLTAAMVVNQFDNDQLTSLFREYGEIPNAPRLVSALLEARSREEIVTTGQFLAAIEKCVPRATGKKYLAQVFQALRMTVNDELTVLKEFLVSSLEVLKPSGRMVVISYHSLEDRLVKNFFRSGNIEGIQEKDFYGNLQTPFRLITRKVMVPDEEEMRLNPRSRSAKLRIAEKKETPWH